VSDLSSPVGASGYRSRRAFYVALFLLVVSIAGTLSWAAVKADTETQRCEGLLWSFVDYCFRPEHYAKKCGCPHGLDLRFSCNSQYIPLLH
jgi:hypothetical protein